jgi:hypothetical protein
MPVMGLSQRSGRQRSGTSPAEDHWRGEQPDLDKERHGVAHVAVLHVESREPHAHPERGQHHQSYEQRHGQQLPAKRDAEHCQEHQLQHQPNA